MKQFLLLILIVLFISGCATGTGKLYYGCMVPGRVGIFTCALDIIMSIPFCREGCQEKEDSRKDSRIEEYNFD